MCVCIDSKPRLGRVYEGKGEGAFRRSPAHSLAFSFTSFTAKHHIPELRITRKSLHWPTHTMATSFPLQPLEIMAKNHAILATTGFLILLPVGVLVARYARTFTPVYVVIPSPLRGYPGMCVTNNSSLQMVPSALCRPIVPLWSCDLRGLVLWLEDVQRTGTRTLPRSSSEDGLGSADPIRPATIIGALHALHQTT